MTAIDSTAERSTRAHQYLQEGRDDLVIPQYEKVLAHQLRVLGADHPQTLTFLQPRSREGSPRLEQRLGP